MQIYDAPLLEAWKVMIRPQDKLEQTSAQAVARVAS
jgi:hypothetical protein